MTRSLLAVLVGFAATVVLSVTIDLLVRAVSPGAFGADGRSPGGVMMAVAVAYTLACAAAGGYVAGLIARRHEVLHALLLGTLGAFATLAVIMTAPPDQRTAGPFVTAMLVIPATTLGGWLRAGQSARTRT